MPLSYLRFGKYPTTRGATVICLDRAIYTRVPAKVNAGINSHVEKIDERTAMRVLIMDMLDQAVHFHTLNCDRISVSLNGPRGRSETISLFGPVQHMRPLILVARQYLLIRQLLGDSMATSSVLQLQDRYGVLNPDWSGDLPEPVLPIGSRYSQPWGGLAEQHTLKLSVILALCPDSGPKHIAEDLIGKNLNDLIVEMLDYYDYDISETLKRVFSQRQPVA